MIIELAGGHRLLMIKAKRSGTAALESRRAFPGHLIRATMPR
jgi:hypothetical protein